MQNCRAELALSASRMGASPANSFVSTSDALALQSTREHRDPIKIGRLLAENQQIPLLFAGNRSGIGQDTLTMKRYSLLLGFLIGTICSTLSAQGKVDMQPNATVLSIL